MAKPQPATLARATAVRALERIGYSPAQAKMMVDRGAAGTAPRRGPGRPRNGGGEVRPFPDEDGVAAPGRMGHLYAKIDAAADVSFNNQQLAAIWEGMIDALRQAGQVDPASLYPERFWCEGTDPAFAQYRAIGREMARITGPVLASLDVSADEWAAWYATKASVRLVNCAPPGMAMPWQQQQMMAAPSVAPPPALDTGWGTLTGAPQLPARR